VKLSFWTIRKKIGAILAISVVAVSVLSLIDSFAFNKFTDRYKQLTEVEIRQLVAVDDVKSDIFKIQSLITTESTYAYFSASELNLGKTEKLNGKIVQNLEALLQLAKNHRDGELERIVQNLQMRYGSFYRMCIGINEIYATGDKEYIAVFVKGLNDISSKMYQELTQLHDFAHAKLSSETERLSTHIESNRNMILFITLFGIVAMIVATLYVSGFIIRSLNELIFASKHLVEGDYDLKRRLPVISRDELGVITDNFNGFTDTVEAMDKQIKDHARQLEEKVRIEVEKNREKDQLMIRQSRNAAMWEMMGNIAHQWRQPINALGLILQDLKDAYRFGELDEAYVDKANINGMKIIDNMSKTIDDFRDFFRPNKEMNRFSVKSVCEDALGIIGGSLRHNTIKVISTYEDEGVVEGFPNEFSQVVLNVLSNAQYELEKRRPVGEREIHISLSCRHGIIELVLADNAGGISDELLGKIFDPYFTTKEQGEGTGIGLYMSKMIIEKNMDGKLYARNTAEGAEFVITMQEARG
jgi:signal transduction histidine kinase